MEELQGSGEEGEEKEHQEQQEREELGRRSLLVDERGATSSTDSVVEQAPPASGGEQQDVMTMLHAVLRRLRDEHPVIHPAHLRDLVLADRSLKDIPPEQLAVRLKRDAEDFYWVRVRYREQDLRASGHDATTPGPTGRARRGGTA
jgi:hypothetical protein